MPNMHRSNFLVLLLLTLALGLFSCKSGVNNRNILGGKKNKNKNFFDRYLPKTFHAKKHPKTKVLPKADEQEGDNDKNHVTSNKVAVITTEESSTPNPLVPEAPELAIQPDASTTAVMDEQIVPEITNNEVQDLVTPAIQKAVFHSVKTEAVEGVVSSAAVFASSTQEEVNLDAVKTAAAIHQASGLGKKVYLGDFKKSIITLHQKAEKKGKSYLWVMYFAIVQGFTALFLGFKQIFNMLDTPIDSGNKALGISYAAIAILAIHAMLLIGLVKNFV